MRDNTIPVYTPVLREFEPHFRDKRSSEPSILISMFKGYRSRSGISPFEGQTKTFGVYCSDLQYTNRRNSGSLEIAQTVPLNLFSWGIPSSVTVPFRVASSGIPDPKEFIDTACWS